MEFKISNLEESIMINNFNVKIRPVEETKDIWYIAVY